MRTKYIDNPDFQEVEKKFAKNLKILAIEKEKQLTDICGAFGISEQVLNAYLSGKNFIPLPLAVKIADYFGVTILELVSR